MQARRGLWRALVRSMLTCPSLFCFHVACGGPSCTSLAYVRSACHGGPSRPLAFALPLFGPELASRPTAMWGFYATAMVAVAVAVAYL